MPRKNMRMNMRTQGEIVILLHGIARTKRSMFAIERALRRAGYDTLGITYPSLRMDIAALAGFIARALVAVWAGPDRVHFVTHSMGGLVAARYLSDFAESIPAGRLGRVVMLAPPAGGSEVADLLKRFSPYRWFYGPAGRGLTTRRDASLGTLSYDLGIIAGRRGWPYLLGNMVIRGPHDGRVAVARTRVPGM